MMEAIDPPDGGWGWVIVLGVSFQGFFTWGVFGCFPLFYQPLMREFNVGLGQVTWINGAYEIGRALGYLFIPLMVSRLGYRKSCVFLSGLSALGISLASAATSDSFVYILLGFIPGYVNASLSVSSLVIVSRYFKKRRMMAISLSKIGIPMGTLVLAPLLQVLIDQYGIRGAILIVGGMNFNCVAASALFRPIRLHTDKEQNMKSSMISSCSVLKLYKIWIIVLILLTAYGGYRLYLSYLVPLALDRLDVDPVAASLLLSIAYGSSMGMRGVLSIFGDHKRVDITSVTCVSMLFASFVCVGVWFVNSYSWLVVNCVLFSITTVTFVVMQVPVLTRAIGEENLQSGLSWSGFMCTILASAIIPGLGSLIDVFNEVRVGFVAAAVLFFASCLLLIPLLRKPKVAKNENEVIL